MTTIFNHPKDLLNAVGTALGPTQWITVDQQRIQQFADATDDHQWIHVDPEAAAKSPFGSCIAHGFLTLSLANKFLPELIEVKQITMGINYGCDRVRFPNIVKAGQRIRGEGKIISAEAKPKSIHAVIQINIEVEGEAKLACRVDSIVRFYY